MSAGTVEPGRLLRALRLEVEELEPGRYRVTGGAESHAVTTPTGAGWTCDCLDSVFHPAGSCKHRLAVYLTRQLADPIREALRDLNAGAT